MIIEQMSVSVLPSERERFTHALVQLLSATEVLPGCLSCSLSLVLPDENILRVEVDWESWEYLLTHLKSETYKKFLLLMELSPAPPVLRFYSVEEIRGLDLVEFARSSETFGAL